MLGKDNSEKKNFSNASTAPGPNKNAATQAGLTDWSNLDPKGLPAEKDSTGSKQQGLKAHWAPSSNSILPPSALVASSVSVGHKKRKSGEDESDRNEESPDLATLLSTTRALLAAFDQKGPELISQQKALKRDKQREKRHQKREQSRLARGAFSPTGIGLPGAADIYSAKGTPPLESSSSEKEDVDNASVNFYLCHSAWDRNHSGSMIECRIFKVSKSFFRFCTKHMESHDARLHPSHPSGGNGRKVQGSSMIREGVGEGADWELAVVEAALLPPPMLTSVVQLGLTVSERWLRKGK